MSSADVLSTSLSAMKTITPVSGALHSQLTETAGGQSPATQRVGGRRRVVPKIFQFFDCKLDEHTTTPVTPRVSARRRVVYGTRVDRVGDLPTVDTPGRVGGLPTVDTPGRVGGLPTVDTPGRVGGLPTVDTPDRVGGLPIVYKPGTVEADVSLSAEPARSVEVIPQCNLQTSSNRCELHKHQCLTMYCNQCDVCVCSLCTILHHGDHDCIDINVAADQRRDQLNDMRENLKRFIDRMTRDISELETMKTEFRVITDAKRAEINKEAAKWTALINDHKEALNRELQTGMKVFEEFENASRKAFTLAATFDDLQRLSETGQRQGDEWGIVALIDDFRQNAEKIVSSDWSRSQDVEVIFTPSNVELPKEHLLGNMTVTTSIKDPTRLYAEHPQLVHSMALDAPVTGLAVMDTRLYVVRQSHNSLAIFDLTSYKLLTRIGVVCDDVKLVEPRDVAACCNNKRLFITDKHPSKPCIFCLHLLNGDVHRWSTADDEPEGVSVSSGGELDVFVVSFPRAERIDVCAQTDGSVVQRVSLSPAGLQPTHAVLVTDGYQGQDGRLAVCHGMHDASMYHCVCLIDMWGHVLDTYSGHRERAAGEMYWPRHMTVDRHGCLMVVEYGHDRVQLLSSDLTHAKYLVSDLAYPTRLCLTSTHLLVGQVKHVNVYRVS